MISMLFRMLFTYGIMLNRKLAGKGIVQPPGASAFASKRRDRMADRKVAAALWRAYAMRNIANADIAFYTAKM
ncbi:hypothetical protein [Roseovarius sp. MMSF_3281]|uniref:hypothetical protein n=1 Tax=Roseovarius sp. MMSF_3281 TaxID=3046694 RepID=UPI00273E46D8|nr:hypothetical protein [Roseovarius sp. MMSF_3281]